MARLHNIGSDSMPTMDSPWDSLELSPSAETTFRTTIDPRWNVWFVPQGGIVAGIATAAMERVLADATQQLRSMTCVFAGQVHPGEVEIEVAVIRRGRSVSQMTATVRSVGADAGVTAIAVFGSDRKGYEFTELQAPAAPAPETIRSWREGVPDGIDFQFEGPPSPFWANILEGRDVIGTAPWEPFVPKAAEAVSWYRFDECERAWAAPGSAGLLVCLDVMPGAVGERVGRGWFAPSADLTAHLFSSPVSSWLLSHNRARWAGDGYASVDNALWDLDHPDGPTLVAYGTQTMIFTFDKS